MRGRSRRTRQVSKIPVNAASVLTGHLNDLGACNLYSMNYHQLFNSSRFRLPQRGWDMVMKIEINVMSQTILK